jgi:hypothetical protein
MFEGDDLGHALPRQQLVHAGQENLFSGMTALAAEFTVSEGVLMARDTPTPWLQMTNMNSYLKLVRSFHKGWLGSSCKFTT